MFNRLVDWSLHNRMLVLALTLVLCLIGGYTLQKMPVDVFPEFAPPQVIIQTEAPGMAPQEVESLITYPIESVINGTPGVTHVRSKTTVGLSMITIVFDDKSDIYLDRQLINERLQQVAGRLPPVAHTPVMLPVISAVGWLVKYALVSKTVSPEVLRTISDWTIRPRVLALGGIASVVSIGGEVKQYQVRLDPARMLAYGITVEEVSKALAMANQNVPGAFLQVSGTELVVEAIGRVKTLNDIRNTLVAVRNNVPITINNIAEVGFGGEIKRGDGAYNGVPAVIGTISKSYGSDTLKTTKKVEQVLQEIRATLPAGVELHTSVFRQSTFIESAIHNLTLAFLQGGLIVILILFVFLMNWRASLITFLSMPVSFVIGILVLYRSGFGINAMTLGGMAIAIGEVVDDGIITVENVVHRLRLNRQLPNPQPVLQVILHAVTEIRSSVIYATIIISLVFLPIFFLSGIAELIFSPLAIAYIASVLGSLIVSVTFVPALCYLLLAKNNKAVASTKETGFAARLKKGFAPILNWSLRHCKTVLMFTVLAVIGALSLLPFFGSSFLPEFHEGNFIIAMTTLPGTSLDESMRIGKQVNEILHRYPQVLSVSQRAGRSELDEDALPPNVSEFDVRLDFEKNKSMLPDELLSHLRKDLGQIPGAAFNIGQFIAHRMDEVLSGVRSQVAIKLFGDNLTILNQLGDKVVGILHQVPGVVDINKEQQIEVPQLVIKIDRENAARYGLNVGQVAYDLQLLLNGVAVSRVLEGQRTFDLYVRLAKPDRDTIKAIQGVLIDAHGTAGERDKIPLRALADISLKPEPFAINRENVERVLVIGFNVQERDLGSVIAEVKEHIQTQLSLPANYFVTYGGQFESQQQATRVIAIFGVIVIFLMFILLTKAFGSTGEALLVMCNLPLALIGGLVSLYIASADLSVAALIGFITLFGIATRNGIILVSHYNQLSQQGVPPREVVVQGTMDRLIPILMTAATATLGLIPLLLGSPTGKELERPLAQVLLGGLFTSTMLNLIVVPTLYNRWRSHRSQNPQTTDDPEDHRRA